MHGLMHIQNILMGLFKMNNVRRKALNAIISELEDIQSRLEAINDEENEAYDNMPDSIQESERGEQSYNAMNSMSDALSSIESAISEIENARDGG